MRGRGVLIGLCTTLALCPTGPAKAREAVEVAPTISSITPSPSSTYGAGAPRPLSGQVVLIDPGHQLGNSRHPRQINRLVNAGGFRKACNTTGTSTNSGYPEATFAWKLSRALRRQLTARGARVYLTRRTNSYSDWGPCIDVRGRMGNRVHADAVISVHGDGASAGVRGFFVIRPADRRGWTHDVYRVSGRYARHLKAGLVRAGVHVSNSYGGDGLDTRGDLGTLNWSDVPTAMVEVGNMRNAADAAHMTSRRYRRTHYAHGLALGITAFLTQ